MKHKPARLTERLDENPRRYIGDDDDGNNPPENEAKEPGKNRVRITRDVQEVEVSVNETLRAHDPKAHRREAEHDRVMHGDAETERHEVKQDRHQVRNHSEL